MRLLVTGGCGFIGTNFIYEMLGRHDDLVVVNCDKLTYAGNRANLAPLEARGDGRYHFVRADIADPVAMAAVLRQYHIDAVVNFAAESHVDRSIADPEPFITTNVRGAQNLVHCAMQAGVERYVHVSTDEVYGSLGPDDPAFTEATPLDPSSPYSASKASADLIVGAYWKTYGYPAVITRCSNNYGPWQFPEKLIPLMIARARRGEPLPLYGDGTNVRDWIYVTDHCRGVELALLKGRPGAVYNFGGGAELPNIEVVRTILAALGRPESLITFVKDRPGHDRRYAMDHSLAGRELGFAPEYDFARGIGRTLAWYADNQPWVEAIQSGEYRRFMDAWYKDRS
jgi:dTDP-glucose 4,6-dehydratase